MQEKFNINNIMKILIVEDEELFRVSLCDDLRSHGFDVQGTGSAEEAQECIAQARFNVVLTDLRLPEKDGVTLLKWIKRNHDNTAVIIMTAYASVQAAVNAIKLGAYDYITKPFSMDELLLTLNRIRQYQIIVNENIDLKKQLKVHYKYKNLVGKCKEMEEIFELIDVVSKSESSVLINGETGTGKEMIANAIVSSSPRAKGPYIKVSCAIIAKDLMESELFGHVKGAFTGAISDKIGRFEAANGGTILLDDIDDIPLELQVKLLRVLEEHSFEKVGGTKKIKVNFRVIAATKADLLKMSEQGKYRKDLYYRLNVVPINIPALRNRKEDIPLLIEHYSKLHARGDPITFSPNAFGLMIDYPWPGNVRELKNLIERLSLVTKNKKISTAQLPEELLRTSVSTPEITGEYSLENILKDVEIDILKNTLSKMKGNQTKASRFLKIPLSTLRSKLQKYGLL